MATSVQIALRNQYFSLPEGPIKKAVGDEFLRLYGLTPEEDLYYELASNPSISLTDPTAFNAGTFVFDSENNTDINAPASADQLAAAAAAAAAAATAAGRTFNPNTTSFPSFGSTPQAMGLSPSLGVGGVGGFGGDPFRDPNIEDGGPIVLDPEDQQGDCDYRYSIGCPVFSPIPGKPGCNIFMPIHRTCYQKPNPFRVGGTDIYYAPEFLGYIDVSFHALSTREELVNQVQNGITGKRTIIATKFTSESVRNAIDALRQYLLFITPVQKYIDRPDLGPGVIGKAMYNLDDFNLYTILTNLQSQTIAPTGFAQPKATIDEIAEFLSRTCDLSKQTPVCIISDVFEPDQKTPDPPKGPFVDRSKQIEVFGSRKPTGERFSRPVDPNAPDGSPEPHPDKKCVLAIKKLTEIGEFWNATLAFGVYDNPNFNGSPIDYADPVPGPKYPVVYDTVTVWTEVGRDPNCKFTIEERLKEVEDPADACRILVLADIYRHYEDGLVELESRDVFRRSYRKQDAECSIETVKVYHPMDLANDQMTAKIRAKTKGLFNGAQSLLCHHTSSTQSTSSKLYYYDVTDCDSCDTTPYFSVSYGHNKGSGSISDGGEPGDTATHAMYSQCRLMALESPETQFTFYTNGVPTASKDVYIINFSRIGMSDRIDPGNWELSLAELSGSFFANNIHTGSNVKVSTSNKVLKFIDNSGDTSEQISSVHEPYNSYEIVSGSLSDGFFPTSSRHTYGIMYPNLGIMVLDPYKLNTELGFNTVTGSNIAGDNSFKLFTSISGSSVLGHHIKARNVKYKTTNHYMVRVSSTLANFSNNPTWVSGSKGEFLHPSYKLNPQTYITSIGLYNDTNELLAIAKLSKPINKSFENDVLIKIRLNW